MRFTPGGHRARVGFTYVELMIVVSIIGVLVAIAVPNFMEAQVRTKVSRAKADLATIKMAVESYRLENRMYPLNSVKGVSGMWDLAVLTTPVAYLGSIPTDAVLDEHADLHRPYRYFNAMQANPEGGFNVLRDEGFNAYGDGHVIGVLWGAGPALSLSERGVTGEMQSTHIEPNGDARFFTYDPTNGTTSRGDIYTKLP